MLTIRRELIAPLIDRIAMSDTLAESERVALAEVFTEVREFPARKIVVRAHVRQEESQLLLEGIVCRQIELADGRRQILAIHVPGDYIDLHSLLLKSLDHSVVTLSAAKTAVSPHAALRAITDTQPHLTRMLWFATAVDAAVHREWIASLSRPAAGRIAHLLCELRVRLQAVGLANESGYALPITQVDLADATALTPVHVNRTLRQLREAGLVDFRMGRVQIGNLAGLERVADFDPAYLYLEPTAR